MEMLNISLEEALRNKKTEIETKLRTRVENGVVAIERQFESLVKTEKEVRDQLKNINLMPDISIDHARAGLTVSKSSGGGLCWHFRTVYAPKFIKQVGIIYKLKAAFAQKLITPVVLCVETTSNEGYARINVHRFDDLSAFDHYHTNCWKTFKYQSRKWKSVDDILSFSREAMGVLEMINGDSIARNIPNGLPDIQTVRDNREYEIKKKPKLDLTGHERIVTEQTARQGWDTLMDIEVLPEPFTAEIINPVDPDGIFDVPDIPTRTEPTTLRTQRYDPRWNPAPVPAEQRTGTRRGRRRTP
jgi:hypothetical protein